MVWTAFGRIEQPTDGCFRLGLATLGWVSWFNTHRLMATIAILSSRPARPDSSQPASAKLVAVQQLPITWVHRPEEGRVSIGSNCESGEVRVNWLGAPFVALLRNLLNYWHVPLKEVCRRPWAVRVP